ncbi:aldo/keto reductase [Phototrophicus methaneseepsis]|uniref:Aldo/keto reductase n=1 Tax=Phototrophicus methaneseepsis TaxID=2710758 RepID=A0A7S8E7L6_9CHLR|nr:aldo/keto reductase [Phototrophicus methaneseepsis]QPC81812.1 aldo/keto reductase [Phototrophicus methaneseepsis]
MTLTLNSTTTLNNGVEMPIFGLGVYQTEVGSETENAVRWALQAGYRAVDTAALYRNEAEVGKVVQSGIMSREDIFVTSKVWVNDLSYEGTKAAFDASMERLGLDYLDLYLIHWPVNDWQGAWRALEEIYDSDRVRAIGVSNFLPHHLEELLSFAKVAPAVDQIEFHPFLQTPDLQVFAEKNDIKLTAWAPIMKGRVTKVPELIEIGEKYGKSPVHVTLRWMLQIGVITIPKSANKDRIETNADIFDFELTDEDIAVIETLDKGEEGRIGPNPDRFGE